MSALREAAQQALEALEYAQQDRECPSTTRQAITTLRAALAQPDDWTRCHHCGQTMPPVPLGQAEPDLSHCPQCNGPADNGHDRSIPPSPYLCTKCMAEPAQKPVAWHYTNNAGASVWHRRPSNRLDADMQAARDYPHAHKVTPLYLAPPKRTMVPLTEGEIMGAFHAARNAKLGASQDNSRHRLSVVEIARAIEKASWEKNHGQA